VRDVIPVPEEQLKRMLSTLQRYRGLGLAGTNVQVIEVVRDRLVEGR
jgi:hypothetical protein